MKSTDFLDTRKFTFNGDEYELIVTEYYGFAHLYLFLPPEEHSVEDWNPVIEAATIARKEWDRIRWLMIDLEQFSELDPDDQTEEHIQKYFVIPLDDITKFHQYVHIDLIEITNARKFIEDARGIIRGQS